jgi:hypothetical protein
MCTLNGLTNPHSVSISLKIKVNTGSVRIGNTQGYTSVTKTTSIWEDFTITPTNIASAYEWLAFLTTNITDNFDILVYNPMINLGSQLYHYIPPAGLPQQLTDYSGHGNHAQLGSTASADTNDPVLTGTGVKHTTNQYCLSNTVAMNLQSFTEAITGKFDGTSGVIWSLADSTVTTKYQAVKQVSAGNVAIISRNGEIEMQSANLAVSATDNITLHFSASGGVLTLINLSTGQNVTLVDTAPIASAARIGVGCVASSTVAQVISSMTWYNQAPYSRPLVSSESIRAYRYIKNIEASRGVTVA